MEQKRKEEIRKSIIACDNDIVKLRSQAENLEEIIKNQKCTQKRFESECDKYEIKRQKKKIKLENMLEEKYDMISSIMYKRQILKYELRRLG